MLLPGKVWAGLKLQDFALVGKMELVAFTRH